MRTLIALALASSAALGLVVYQNGHHYGQLEQQLDAIKPAVPPVLTSVTFSYNGVQQPATATQQEKTFVALVAEPVDQFGNPWPVTSVSNVTWTTSNITVQLGFPQGFTNVAYAFEEGFAFGPSVSPAASISVTVTDTNGNSVTSPAVAVTVTPRYPFVETVTFTVNGSTSSTFSESAGTMATLAAMAIDSNGNTMQLTSPGATVIGIHSVVWNIDNPAVVSIDQPTGQLVVTQTGISPGVANITVTITDENDLHSVTSVPVQITVTP